MVSVYVYVCVRERERRRKKIWEVSLCVCARESVWVCAYGEGREDIAELDEKEKIW